VVSQRRTTAVTKRISSDRHGSKINEVNRLKDRAYAAFGAVDVVMNNAGTSPGGQPSSGTEGLQTHRWREMDSNRRSPVRGTTLFETAPFDFSAPSSTNPRSGSRPARRSKPRAGSASGRLSALRSTFIPRMLVDKEGRRNMLRCSRSASWGTLGSNRAGGHAG
jgi:hypothetical protein